MRQMGKEVVMKGGFVCPQDLKVPPSALCVQHKNSFTDWGYHNDFHGTYIRVKDDFHQHPVYRLDPLTNKHSSQKIYGTQKTGLVEEGIPHTHTFLYYDSGGVGDTGN